MNELYKNKDWLHNEYYINKRTLKEIAINCNIDRRIVGYWKNKFCISIPNREYKPDNPNFIDPSKFTNIQTPEISYLLGLLWADGCIVNNNKLRQYRIILTNKEDDALIFKQVLDKIGYWNCSRKTDFSHNKIIKNIKPQLCFSITNKPVVDFLVENGYKTKSWDSADKILSKIPENLQYYWFRGLFDGDGSLVIHYRSDTLSISSGYEQNWRYLIILFKKLNIKYSIYRHFLPLGRASKIMIKRRKDILKFCFYIYKNYENDKIGLSRKYNKFKELEKIEIEFRQNRLVSGIRFFKNRYQIDFSPYINGKKEYFYFGRYKTLEEAIKIKQEKIYNKMGSKYFEQYYDFKYKYTN
jgi:hypothetical protein